MAYIKTTWTDRVVATPLTYNLQSNPDGTTTLIPAEGTITQAGTPITASALNNIEDGIADHDTIITDHETRLDTAEPKITTLQNDIYTNRNVPMVYHSDDGALIMQRAGNYLYGTATSNGNFLVSVIDTAHAHYWIVGIVHYQNNDYLNFTKIAGNQLTVVTNTLGTISVSGLAGTARFVIQRLGSYYG